MKNIICFTESLAGGGAEHQLAILSEMLAEKGYHVSLVTYASVPDHYVVSKDVKRIDIGSTKKKSKTLKALVKFMKVFHYFLWVKTDCVITYRQRANLRVLVPLLFRSRRIKVISSERNLSITSTFIEKVLFNFLYKRTDYIVPNSQAQNEYIARVKPNLTPKLHTIHNYTDLKQFAVSDIPKDITMIKVAIFSRFSKQKNPIGFASAIAALKGRTNRSFEVHWYGEQKGDIDGFNQPYLSFKKEIDRLGIKDVLILHPAVKKTAEYMNAYHAICLPSLHEGFSNSVAEGICCGKPMLVSNVSDNSVMVHNGVNGFLFDPLQTESICMAFNDFFKLSYDEIIIMSKRSREIAEGLFEKERFIQQYLELIER